MSLIFRCFIEECDSLEKSSKVFQINNNFSIPNSDSSCKRFSPIIENQINNNSNECLRNCFSNETIENCNQFVYNKREFQSTVVTEVLIDLESK